MKAEARSMQRGVAVLEFAFVLPVFMLLLYGLITFGAAFYVQLVVSRAAEDGARIAMSNSATDDAIKSEVVNSLATSTIVPPSQSANYTARRTWLLQQVNSSPSLVVVQRDSACNGAGATDTVSVIVRFPYSREAGTRQLPSLLGEWMPDTLVSCASAQL